MASAHTAYIGLGSNLDDPPAQLKRACKALHNFNGCSVSLCSPLYWNAAIGPGAQPDYLNAVLQLKTLLSPTALLHAMQHIENSQGRTREVRWGARTLDLDLLLFDELSIDLKHLTIPHPHLHERNFVVYPLYDIAPTLRLPNGQALSELIKKLPNTGLRQTTPDTHHANIHDHSQA